MDIIIRTNNRAKTSAEIEIKNVVSAKTYELDDLVEWSLAEIEDIENISVAEINQSLNLVGDTNLSIDKDSLSSIQVIK